MLLCIIFAAGIICLFLGYKFYGTFCEKIFEIDFTKILPSKSKEDGVDYVPTNKWILFGHHFSSIAGAGPIVGPITAALLFGWFPAFIWIVFACIFIGSMHDFAALVVSVRNGGESVSSVCKKYLSPISYKMYLGFCWLSLVYFIIVLTDLTSVTFAPSVANLGLDEKAKVLTMGNSVAWCSLLYIFYAIIFGFFVRKRKMSIWGGTAIFVPIILLTVYFAQYMPMIPFTEMAGGAKIYSIILLVYCFVAAILPVWIMLQPRDYLSSYLLFICMFLSVIGLIFGIFDKSNVINLTDYSGFFSKDGPLFPVMFITIACGAVSGFHSLVAGGTTSKQVKHPKDLKFLGYGAMIMEGVLALISLAAVMVIGKSTVYNNPNSIFAGGFSTFTRSLGIPMNLGSTFALLALSTFLLTSMDSSTRIARYILQEFFHKEDWLHKILYTVAVLILPLVMIFVKMPDAAHPGQYLPVYKAIWPVFGASQQLLAGLCLLVIYIIRKHKNKSTGFVFWPMIFMIVASIVGIIQIMYKYCLEGNYSIVVLSFILLILAYVICHDVIANKIKEKKAKK